MCVCEERGIVITNYGNKEDTNVEKENTAELCSVLLYYVKQNKKKPKKCRVEDENISQKQKIAAELDIQIYYYMPFYCWTGAFT